MLGSTITRSSPALASFPPLASESFIFIIAAAAPMAAPRLTLSEAAKGDLVGGRPSAGSSIRFVGGSTRMTRRRKPVLTFVCSMALKSIVKRTPLSLAKAFSSVPVEGI